MESLPIVSMIARTFMPWEETRHNEYFERWFFKAYVPLLGSLAGFNAVERYRIVKNNPDYPKYIQMWHVTNLKELQTFEKSPEFIAILNSMNANFPGTDFRWWAQYYVVSSWGEKKPTDSQKDVSGGVIHIEGSNISHENDKKYFPLLIGTEGAKRIDRCRIVKDNPKYPSYLTIFGFNNIKEFGEWEKSRADAASPKDANTDSVKEKSWYVQYQLMKSWRK